MAHAMSHQITGSHLAQVQVLHTGGGQPAQVIKYEINIPQPPVGVVRDRQTME